MATLRDMATKTTLLCIHRDPAQLSLLQEKGYDLVTATNGCDGLRLFMSRHVDAILIEYHLGLLDGSTVATQVKQLKPQIPIVMLIDEIEVPDGAFKSVDALVAKSDGDHFLLATVHFVLSVKPAFHGQAARSSRVRELPGADVHAKNGDLKPRVPRVRVNDKYSPFSSKVWDSILSGSVRL